MPMERQQCYYEPALAKDEITGPWVEVNLDHIAHNIRQIEHITANRPVMPVIKANAYGHGLVPVGRFLEKRGVMGICVGKIEEALQLRQAGITCPILNLGPFSEKEAEYIAAHDITQSVFSETVSHLDAAAAKLGKKIAVHVKIDTGLGRVGVPHAKALDYIQVLAKLRYIQIKGVFTSLSEDRALDAIQLDLFLKLYEAAGRMGISLGIRHIASSAGILVYPDTHLDAVRPGITVFGCYPSTAEFRQRKIDLKPTLSLKARVSYKKKLQPGEAVGYHQAYVASKSHLLVTGAIGYPDGYPSHLAGKSEVLIRGRRFPLVAAVTANHIYIKAEEDAPIQVGDEIVLIGRQDNEEISCEELARLSGLSEYKLLACINPLLPRYYISAEKAAGIKN